MKKWASKNESATHGRSKTSLPLQYGCCEQQIATLHSRHVPAPKVVLEEFPNRCFPWVEIIVSQNGSVVVEYKTSIEGIDVGEERCCKTD